MSAKWRGERRGLLRMILSYCPQVWNIAYMFLDLGDAFREAPHYPLFFSIAALSLNNMMSSGVCDIGLVCCPYVHGPLLT